MSIGQRMVEKIRYEGVIQLLKDSPQAVKSLSRPFLISILHKITEVLYGKSQLRTDDIIEGQAAGLTTHQFSHGEQVSFQRKRPTQWGHLAVHSNYSPPPRFIGEFCDGKLIGHDAIVADREGNIVLDSVGGDDWFLAYLFYRYTGECHFRSLAQLLTRRVSNNDHLSSTVFPLLGPHSRTYFHWVIEFLPRVRALQDWIRETGEEATILINPDPADWKIQSLELLGVQKEQWREYPGPSTADKILVAPYWSHHPKRFNGSARALKWLRKQLRSNVAARDSPARIYVSRDDAPHRRVANESELVNTLEEFGFRKVVPTDYSFTEQMELFSGAEVIVGPHGAGLTNLIAAKSAHVIEFFPRDLYRPYFFHISEMVGHEYDYITGRRLAGDMVINKSDVVQAVESA